jgi:DUF971 family protein
MSMQAQAHNLHTKQETEREGIVVWDQKGLVVLWPDGHCSRFSWAALRQACLCAECRQHQEKEETDVKGLSTNPVNSGKDSAWQMH